MTLQHRFEQATLELASAEKALSEAADFVKTRMPVPPDVGIQRAADDPHVILRFGQLRARLHAAQGLLARATRLARLAGIAIPEARERPSAEAASPVPPDEVAALVSLIEARAFTSDLIAEIASQLIAWGGSPQIAQQPRETTAQTPDPTSHWKYHHLGNYYLKGVTPPGQSPEPGP